MWSEGDVVSLRDVWHGRVWRALPSRVVRDTPGETVFWVPAGTENAYPVDDDGREVRLSRDGVRWATRLVDHDTLVLDRPDEPWSIWHFRHDDGTHRLWYVNLEEPLGRNGPNLDSRDHKLDLLVQPDGSWSLKDEDELAEAAALKLLDDAAVRADAERALRERPWPTGWEEYRPDPPWEALALPPGWDEL